MASVSSVMFMFRIVKYRDYIFVSQDGLFVFFMFVVFLLPAIFKLTLPISLFIASTMTASRMSHDRELEAWSSCGVSVLRMARTPAVLGVVMVALSMFTALYVEPYARVEWSRFRWMHARKSLETLVESRLQEKTFLPELFRSSETEISLYVDTVSRDKSQFGGVFLATSNPKEPYSFVLVAERGRIQNENRAGLPDFILHLRKGRYYQPRPLDSAAHLPPPPPQAAREENPASPAPSGAPPPPPAGMEWTVVEFDEMKFSLVSMFQSQFDPNSPNETDIRSSYPPEYIASLKELRAKPGWREDRRIIRDHTYFYEQIVVPLSCLFLPLIGLCIGILDPRQRSSRSFVGMALVMFGYYAVVMVSQQFALRGWTSPEVTLWLSPLYLLGTTALLLRWRTAYPPSTGLAEALASDFGRLRSRGARAQEAAG